MKEELFFRFAVSLSTSQLLLYVPRMDKILWLGPEIYAGRQAIQIRLEPSKNGQTKGCLFAKDYVW
jgi:hypothetical protein